jgi:hypothetical protein
MLRSLEQFPTPVNARGYPRRVAEGATLELGGVRWRLAAGADASALAPLLERALRQLAGAQDLRSGRRKRLFRLALGTGPGPDHLLKRSGYRPSRGRLRHARGSKARRELAIAQGLAARGVPVVVPLAAGERRRAGRLIECFLLAPLLGGALDLRRHWSERALAPAERRRLVRSLGQLVRRAHDAGLHQDDLAPNNVLVSGAAMDELRLVDFERARLRWRVGAGPRRRTLAKLLRAAAGLSAAQRLRFLHAYAGSAEEARRWWRQLEAEAPRLARRDYTRMRRVAARDGRRFRRVERAGWRGFALAGAESGSTLTGRLAGPPPAAGMARIEGESGCWRVVYPRLSARRARQLWACANLLAARGFAPAPLALLSDGQHTLLIAERAAGAHPLTPGAGAPGRAAAARLLSGLSRLGELDPALVPEEIAVVNDHAGPPRAQLITPHAFRFGGRPGGRRSREIAARLLASLAPPAPAV